MCGTRSLTAVLVAVLLAGCAASPEAPSVVSVGSGSASAAAGSGNAAQVVAYRDCLVANGAVLVDHPTEEGLPQIDKERTPVDVASTAAERCRAFVPSGGEVAKPDPKLIEARQRYAACLRQNGIPDYPDPDPQTGDPRIGDDLAGRLKEDPKLPAAEAACHDILTGAGDKGTVGG
ncbi:hypothetical protein ABZ816_30475 [Actinosynnema sp. NPDC047251]|uniref:Putative secreted protein n=1 Tax=Saccharothrix espanaensis (strain ATCC 51144 / DSM 44229 / JCM 9112 / NBRC 15066 / NRRL 15764) TaxID=1179773 RepID=K0K549_SACES|nr:hypothetical protein [Saccharothrix espanaensis]CCH32712.1 putative secreted protein [Saccharothrix espanaensis DSM 44229]